MPFNPDTVDTVLQNIARLQELKRRQDELFEELKAALIAECGKRLDHPKARAVFIAAKEAALEAKNLKFNAETGKMYSKSTGRPLGSGIHYDPEAEYICRQLRHAECYEVHGGCDIDKDTDNCRRCGVGRTEGEGNASEHQPPRHETPR